jgi:very-short-patch-repair endonuclease
MSAFNRNLDELLHLSKKKDNLVHHLKKNYKENVHYIIANSVIKNLDKKEQRGGHNKIIYMLSEEAFELLKNSFNLRNRYIVNLSDNVKCINSIGMCIESQTIGFIENAYSGALNVKRQYIFGKYRADLYFIDHKLVIECDENNHDDRDPTEEKVRENYITSLGNTIIRFNPNESEFDLSNVMRNINVILFKGCK